MEIEVRKRRGRGGGWIGRCGGSKGGAREVEEIKEAI